MDHATPARFLAAREATATTPVFPAPLPELSCPPPHDSCARRLHEQLPRPHAALYLSVIIPAKDEAANVPAALAALAAQTDLHGQPLPPHSFEVIVLANNCTDATAAVARQYARRWPHLAVHVVALRLPAPQAHVGRARRLLMDAACARLEAVGQPGGIIASTDADTCVAPTWLAAIRAEIASGAAAVGGRILTQVNSGAPFELASRRVQVRDAAYRQLCARLEDLIDPAPADPWPRHHQHFGASLALTARAYRQVGGLPEVRFLEDEALYQALRRNDLSVRHSPHVQVLTSARQQGRVEVGLSWQLREWQHLSQQQREPHVEHPAQLAARWQLRCRLRGIWADRIGQIPTELAGQLGLPTAALQARLNKAATFGQFWEWVVEHGPAISVAYLPLSQALRVLPLLIKKAEATKLVPVRASAICEAAPQSLGIAC